MERDIKHYYFIIQGIDVVLDILEVDKNCNVMLGFVDSNTGEPVYSYMINQYTGEGTNMDDEIVLFCQNGSSDIQSTPDTPDIKNTHDQPENQGLYGDVDGDGKISAKDSMLIQRYVINLKQLTEKYFIAADVNGDGKVTNKDAFEILRYVLNLSKNEKIGTLKE